MRGGDRLAGRCPLDGRVRRRAVASLRTTRTISPGTTAAHGDGFTTKPEF
jgi:hypothetical protein